MTNHTPFFIFSIVVFCAIVAIAVFGNGKPIEKKPTPVACTMDAKVCPDGTAVGRKGPNCEFEACPVQVTEKQNLIKVTTSLAGALTSPLEITGEARGTWYFEASFPVRIYDANNVLLGFGIAQAQGDWMTENFVPFKATLSFTHPATEKGFLVLEKDNPSGLPEHADELRIPVHF